MAVAAAAFVLAGCGHGGKAVSTASPGTTLAAIAGSDAGGTGDSTPPAEADPSTTVAVGGGGGVVSSPTTTARTTPTTPTTPTSRPPSQGMILLTSADANRTFAVARGQMVQLTLSDEGNQWGLVQVDPSGLLLANPAPAPPAHGQLVIWTAASPGTVKVTAVATAYCAAGTACPMYARLFELTLVIS